MTNAPEIAPEGEATDPQRLDAAVRDFVDRTYGLRGTLGLHRSAVGLDLIRAPVNVALAPIFLLTRLAAMLAVLCRLRRLGDWLARREILLETDVERRSAAAIAAFVEMLRADGFPVAATGRRVDRAVKDCVTVRNAVAEITTSLAVILAGLAVFHSATPGIVSLAGPVASARAQAAAVAGFPLGDRLGSVWYAAFPVRLDPLEILLTGLGLAMLASVVTTFAGVLADPLQVATGTHRRRLLRMLRRIREDDGAAPALAGEHLAARLGDFSDIALSLWRAIKG